MTKGRRAPFYSKVEDAILDKIQAGDLSPGSKIPSIRDLAQQFGVAKSTVERAIYRLADRGILVAHQGKGVFVSDRLPRREEGKSKVLGLLSAMHIGMFTSKGFYAEVLSGIQESLMDLGWSLLVINEKGRPDAVPPPNLHPELVDGYIVSGPVGNRFINLVRGLGKPMVLLDHDGSTMGFDSVVADNIKGSFMITKYMLEQGRRDLVFLGGILKQEPDPEERHLIDTSARERFEGFRLALESEGIHDARERLIRVVERTFRDARDAFAEAWELGLRPDGVVTFGKGEAQGVIEFLESKGVKVPRDVSVVGFGGGSPIGDLVLTGADFDSMEMGRRAGRLAVERIQRGFDAFKKEIIPVSFVEGTTVSPKKRPRS